MDAIVAEAFALAVDGACKFPIAARGLLVGVLGRLLPATFDHRPSMLADLQHRGRTEIGALNGKVVEMADRLDSARR